MSKKEISILVIVFLSVLVISTLTIYSVMNKTPSEKKENKTEKVEDTLKIGKYSLKYGTYKGSETEYNPDTKKVYKKEVTITLSKDKINGEYYIVKGTSLYVNGYELYKVTANNKIEQLAGEGVEFEYEGK